MRRPCKYLYDDSGHMELTKLERMDTMGRLAVRELYKQMQSQIILELQDDEIPCTECKGMRFIYIEKDGKSHFEYCRRCYTGKLYVCRHCGEKNKTNYCNCKESREERSVKYRMQVTQKEIEAFKTAKKIHYKDYDGKFILKDSDYVKDLDGVAEWIEDLLREGEEPPEYLWATEKEPCFSINLYDIIYDKCEDGYEYMYERLNTSSPLLKQAQKLITQWEEEQGDSLCVYHETSKAVIITDLVEEIRKEIQSEQSIQRKEQKTLKGD